MPSLPNSPVETTEPGQLLAELESRQDEAMKELEALDEKLIQVLESLGVTPEKELEELPPRRAAA